MRSYSKSNKAEYEWGTESKHIWGEGKQSILSAGHSSDSITIGSGSLGLNNAKKRPLHIRYFVETLKW